MVRVSRALMKEVGLSKPVLGMLVCPLSKQPLRLSDDSSSLVCDSLGVSYPVVNGIPCLVPKDGKLLENSSTDHDNPDKDNTQVEENQP